MRIHRRLAARVAVAAVAVVLAATAFAPAAPAAAGASDTTQASATSGEVFGGEGSAAAGQASTATLPAGFQDSVVWSGLTRPTAIAFAPDGKVFVAQQSGVILEWPSTSATTPIAFADLSTQVDDFWDRGLLGLAVDPQFGTPGHDYVYALYTYDAPPGQTAPVWNDACPGSPNGPGPTKDGCVVTGRLSRFPVNPEGTAGAEQVVLGSGWCQQFPSHSVGHLAFLPDGSLLVSGGDGANFNAVDYGQAGGKIIDPATGQPYTPANPCGDPPNGVGVANTAPTGRGGALRSQSLRRPAGEPVLRNGTVLRVDPGTGDGLPGNPLFDPATPGANAGRIVAYGVRNPFRFTVRPGTSQVWIGDVGLNTWEEIDRLPVPTAPSGPRNFGWPCYEGNGQLAGYSVLDQCQALYAEPGASATAPYYRYKHGFSVVSGDGCPVENGSVISGMAFSEGGDYPAEYNGALFFADHSRSCIWAMLLGADGMPDPATIVPFVVDPATRPVDLEIDPASGDLFYVSYEGGAIHRVTYFATNQPPVASATADPTYGELPLTVSFDGTGSADPDGSIDSYAWDFGDGTSATGPEASHTYTVAGKYHATLRVTDTQGKSNTTQPLTIDAGNTPPEPVIDTPTSSRTYAAGEVVGFTGHAPDLQDGDLGGSSLEWTLIVHHCSTGCHTHHVGVVGTGAAGSFSAPDHDYPSHLELQLTATDSGGLSATTSVLLQPRTVSLSFLTTPLNGLKLVVDSEARATPFSVTVVANSGHSVSAISPQKYRRKHYVFVSWSDGKAASHDIVAPDDPTTYVANYVKRRRATSST